MITVILPTYRPEKYLLDCLESLGKQTLIRCCFRVIVILNGDRDPYYSCVSKWLEEMDFESELIYTDTKGVSNARNIALDKVSTPFVAFIDDDDYVSPDYLKSLFECINDNPEGTVACSDVRTFDEKGNFGSDYISRAYNKAVASGGKSSMFSRRRFLSSSCCKLIPMSIIGQRRFNPEVRIGEDSLFMASISDRITSIMPASDNAIYYRRLRMGSATRSKEPLLTRIRRKISLIGRYIGIYINGYPAYSIVLFMTRIVAIIKS